MWTCFYELCLTKGFVCTSLCFLSTIVTFARLFHHNVSQIMVPGTVQPTMISVSKQLDKTFTVIYGRYLVTVMMKVAHKIGAREV